MPHQSACSLTLEFLSFCWATLYGRFSSLPWSVRFLVKFAISVLLFGLILRVRHGHEKDDFDKMISYELKDDDYGKVPATKFVETLTELSWPKYQGYVNHYANPDDNPPDPLLLKRILFAEENQKQPLVRLMKNDQVLERHPWKFEKIIHQSWIDENIPAKTAKWVKKWLILHPDWTYMFWTDDTAREFVRLHFPALLPAYDSWNIPVAKADMFRYIILYAMGGVWADLDMEVLKPIDEIREWSSCILSREPDVQVFVMSDFMPCWGNNWTFTCNAFMACRSHHPFLHYLIARTVQNSPFLTEQNCTLNRLILCTGPWMMSFAYTFYIRSVPETIRKTHKEVDVICPHYEVFLPTFDSTRLALVKTNCKKIRAKRDPKKKRQQAICAKYRRSFFRNKPTSDSITTHHWFHSYHFDVKRNSRDISSVTKAVFWSPENDNLYHVCYTEQCLPDDNELLHL